MTTNEILEDADFRAIFRQGIQITVRPVFQLGPGSYIMGINTGQPAQNVPFAGCQSNLIFMQQHGDLPMPTFPDFLRVPGITAAALALFSAPLAAGEVNLQGEGKVQYTPDSARLQFTARAEATEASEAREQVVRTMKQWNRRIRPHHAELDAYDDSMLSLSSYTRPPRQNDGQPVPVTVVSQTIRFELRGNLEPLNPVLDIARDLGFNYHLGDGNFFHSDEAGLEKQALALAIEDARERCRFVADKLDRTCGDVQTININSSHSPRPMMMSAEASGRADKSVSSVGPREVSASVSASFELD